MAYAGAPEPLEVNDVGMHGFIRGEIFIDPRTGDHRTRVEFVPVARRTYVSVEIPVTASTTGLELEDRVRRLTGGKATIRDTGEWIGKCRWLRVICTVSY